MGRNLLFCIAEEAKPIVHKVLKADYDPAYIALQEENKFYWLVQYRTLPTTSDGFKNELGDAEDFESEWIGASVEECQNWAREKQFQMNCIEQELFVIVDARTAKDETVLV